MPDDGRPGRTPEADLTAELLPGVTWRRTRDALSRLDGQGAHGDALGIVLSLDILGAALVMDGAQGPNFYLTRLHLSGSLLRGEATVGDIDTVAETAWRWPGEPFGERGGARRWSAYA